MILLKNRDRNPSFKSGKYVEINDAGNYPMELSVDGVCKQETTTGKNRFDVSKLPLTLGGVAISVDKNGNVVLNGTPTITSGYINFIVSQELEFEPDTYTMSVENKKVGIGIAITGFEGKLNLILSETRNSKTYTSTEKYTSTLQINVRYDVGTLNNFILNPQLEVGETKTKYEMFTGNKSSPSPDYPQPISTIENSLKITSCNKNLCDGINQGLYLTSTGEIFGKSTRDSGLCIKCDGISSYTISSNIIQKRYRIAFTKENPLTEPQGVAYNGSNLDGSNSTISKSSFGYKYLIVNATDLSNIQIEQNSTATEYEPYQGSSLNITIPSNEFVGKLDDTYKDILKVEYNEDDGQYHLNLYKRVYKNNSYNGESYNYYISTTARKDGNIECGELQTDQVVYHDGDETIIDLGIVDTLLSYDEITNVFTDSDLYPVINVKYYKDFEFDKILRSGYNIDEQEYEIAKKQMANGKRKRILSSYDDCIIKINLGLLDNKTYQEYKEQLDDGEFHYWSYKYNQYKKANFILTKPSITTEYAYDDDIGIDDIEITLEKSSDVS